MRRKDREIAEEARVDEVVQSCDCCRLGLSDESGPYIVPLNFGYVRREGNACFYFHGAAEGKKLDLIRKNPNAGFELDTGHVLQKHEQACGYSFGFQSVIGTGRAMIVEDQEEKRRGLELIMEHYTGKSHWEFQEKMLEMTVVIKLEVREMSGKEHTLTRGA